jgi:serine/threonine-protein kinase
MSVDSRHPIKHRARGKRQREARVVTVPFVSWRRWVLGDLTYVPVAAALFVLLPSGRQGSILFAIAAVVLFLLANTIALRLTMGVAACLQPAFVLMLFAIPLNIVPIVALTGVVVGLLSRKWPLQQVDLARVLGDGWYCVAPTVVIALAAPGPATPSRWPVYAIAFAVQFVWEETIGTFRWGSGQAPVDRATLLLPVAVDALLTPVGLGAAILAPRSSGTALALMAGVLGVLALMAEERRGRIEYEHRALRDALTGLANRELFEELVDAAWRRCLRAQTTGALLIANIDRFEPVNDRYGHPAGDEALRAFAERLTLAVRDADTVARLREDQFAVLLGDSTTLEAAQTLAETITDALLAPLRIPEIGELRLTTSVGAATFGVDATPTAAFAEAERALQTAKRALRIGDDGQLLGQGALFAGYRITSIIARGGMGIVYAARSLDTGEPVALKLLAPELADSLDARDRFAREAGVGSQLQHPSLVHIRASGEHRGRLYLVMDLIDGDTLRSVLTREGPMTPERAVRIITQIADALDTAHMHGLIHRDVKPANILLGHGPDSEHPYLVDFGISGLTASDTELTRTGSWVGSVDCVAPEMIESSTFDERTDVYSLGCLLHEMLTGKPVFDRNGDAAKLFAHLNAPIPTLDLPDAVVSGTLDRVLATALAKNPNARYSTAGALAAAARAAVKPLTAAHTTPCEPVSEPHTGRDPSSGSAQQPAR